MPNRIVREAILSSEKVSSLSWAEEVLYRRLMSIVDDYGRHEANPKLLRSKCYPMQIDDVSVDQVAKWLTSCQKAEVLMVYQANGKMYLQINNFGQQQRSASKCPAPDSNCSQSQESAHLGVVVSEVVSVSVSEVDKKDSCSEPATPPAELEKFVITFPLNTGLEWGMPESKFHEFVAIYPQADVIGELRKMKGWFIGNPSKRKTKAGILRFVNNWLSKAQDSPVANRNNGQNHAQPKLTPAERIAVNIALNNGGEIPAGYENNRDVVAEVERNLRPQVDIGLRNGRERLSGSDVGEGIKWVNGGAGSGRPEGLLGEF